MYKKIIYIIIISLLLVITLFFSTAQALDNKKPGLEEKDNSSSYYLGRGISYYKAKSFPEAIIELEKAKEANPPNKKINNKIEKYLKASRKKLSLQENKVATKLEFYKPKLVTIKEKGKVLSLNECVDIAVENHIPSKIAKEQIKLARLKTYEAARAFFPSMTANYSRSTGISRSPGNEMGLWRGIDYGMDIKQPVFHGGEIAFGFQQATINLKIAEENYKKIKSDLIIEVGKAYYALCKSVSGKVVYNKLFTEFKTFFDFSVKALKMEIISQLEALNIESLYNQANYLNLESESEYELSRLTLEQKMNIEDSMDFEIDTNLKEKVIDVNMKDCLKTALLNRSEIKIAFMTVDSSRFGKLVAQAKMFPKIDLMGRIGKSAERYAGENTMDVGGSGGKPDPTTDWFFGAEFSWLLGGNTLSYNTSKRIDLSRTINTFYGGQVYVQNEFKMGILDNLKAYSDQKEADIVYQKSLNELNETKQKITQEVKEAFYTYKKSTIQLGAAKSKLNFEDRESQILNYKRSMGETETSELMSALLRKTQSDIGYLEALSNLNFAVVALTKAVGIENYFTEKDFKNDLFKQ